MEFSELFGFGEKPPPPAAREFVDNLSSVTIHHKGEKLTNLST